MQVRITHKLPDSFILTKDSLAVIIDHNDEIVILKPYHPNTMEAPPVMVRKMTYEKDFYEYTQFPIEPCIAGTPYSIQGLTFINHSMIVNNERCKSNNGVYTYGQAFVCCSRHPNGEYMKFLHPPKEKDFTAHLNSVRFDLYFATKPNCINKVDYIFKRKNQNDSVWGFSLPHSPNKESCILLMSTSRAEAEARLYVQEKQSEIDTHPVCKRKQPTSFAPYININSPNQKYGRNVAYTTTEMLNIQDADTADYWDDPVDSLAIETSSQIQYTSSIDCQNTATMKTIKSHKASNKLVGKIDKNPPKSTKLSNKLNHYNQEINTNCKYIYIILIFTYYSLKFNFMFIVMERMKQQNRDCLDIPKRQCLSDVANIAAVIHTEHFTPKHSHTKNKVVKDDDEYVPSDLNSDVDDMSESSKSSTPTACKYYFKT